MGLFVTGDSIFGFDFNQDGNTDYNDDVLQATILEEEIELEEEEEFYRRRSDCELLIDGMDDEEIVEEYDFDTDDFDIDDCDFDDCDFNF